MKKFCKFIEETMYSIICRIAKKIHIEITKEKLDTFIQFIKFGLIGAFNTILSYITFVVINMVGFNFHIGNLTGYIVCVLNSFYWNNKYVFKIENGEKRSLLRSLIKTFISYAFTGLIVAEILLIFWINIVKIPELIAPLLNLLITIPMNFIMNRCWAFKKAQR